MTPAKNLCFVDVNYGKPEKPKIRPLSSREGPSSTQKVKKLLDIKI